MGVIASHTQQRAGVSERPATTEEVGLKDLAWTMFQNYSVCSEVKWVFKMNLKKSSTNPKIDCKF